VLFAWRARIGLRALGQLDALAQTLQSDLGVVRSLLTPK
jgi:hypothetical protein